MIRQGLPWKGLTGPREEKKGTERKERSVEEGGSVGDREPCSGHVAANDGDRGEMEDDGATLVMGFTGYLLPFDQRSFWATVVGVNINGTGPIIGPYLSDFLRAGPEFGGSTLQRFYSIHMLLIPGALIALIGAHLYLVTKLGTVAPPWLRGETKPRSLREEKI